MKPTAGQRLRQRLAEEYRHLTRFTASDRRWPMPFAAALSSGLPLLVGAGFGHLDYGLISSLGGMVFLSLPETPLHHRMLTLMACVFAMIASYTLGVISHLFPPAMVPALSFVAIVVTMTCRYYHLGPPGGFFFILAASVGAHMPGDVLGIPLKVGLLTMGCLLAALIAFAYSLLVLRTGPARPIPPRPAPDFDFVVVDAVIIGSFVGLSLGLAQLLQLDQPYWVPISCLAVIQGMSLRAVWTKQIHRIAGTTVGLLLAWALLSLPLDAWRIAFVMIVLAFVIETLVVRHYALAAIFITPLTLLLAEAAHLGETPVALLIHARFWDTVLGSLVGLAGGICLHSPRLHALLGTPLRRLLTGR